MTFWNSVCTCGPPYEMDVDVEQEAMLSVKNKRGKERESTKIYKINVSILQFERLLG